MDILDHIAYYIKAELGDDIFTDARREDFLVKFRMEYGKDRHYVYSLDGFLHERRVREVFTAFRSGLSPREISERIGVSKRRVNQILATVVMVDSAALTRRP